MLRATGIIRSSRTMTEASQWPSVMELKQKLLKNHSTALPESIRTTLMGFDNDDGTARDQDQAATRNLNQIGAMTQSLNNFLKRQMTKNTSEAVYTPATLDAYDAMVWDFNSPFHWRIHRRDIDTLYDEGLKESKRHCEVAVGTGLFLRSWATRDKENSPRRLQHLTLMDLSQNALDGCYQRLCETNYFGNQSVTMETSQSDIMKEPNANLRGTYDSVAANFLLHCLHGASLKEKRSAIESCAALLKPDGVFFGSTILGKDLEDDAARAGPHAIATNQCYNELGIFGNQGDSFDDLSAILDETFHEVTIYKVGYCAVWLVRSPMSKV